MAKILVIEDDTNARNAISRTLKRNGFEVITAPDGRRGLKLIEEKELDLVLTDIFMPDMDGLETVRAIAKNKSDLPIIAMTGSIEKVFLAAALKFGAISGLSKPFTPDELLCKVNGALKMAKKKRPSISD